MRSRCRSLTVLAVSAVLLAGCSADEPETNVGDESVASTPGSPSDPTSPDDALDDDESAEPEVTSPTVEPEETEGGGDGEQAGPPVSVLGLAEQRHRGDRLRLGAVREQSSEYTSYDVTFRSRSTTGIGEESYTITGVLNVPTGRGPFPAVVLAHGYIDPAYLRARPGDDPRARVPGRARLHRLARRLPQPRRVG